MNLDGIKHWPKRGSIHPSSPDPKRAGREISEEETNEQIQVHLIRQKANSPHFQATEKKIIPLAGPSSITESHLSATKAQRTVLVYPRLRVSTYSELYSVSQDKIRL